MKSLIAAIAAATDSQSEAENSGKRSLRMRTSQLLALSLLSPICVVAFADTQRFDIPAQPLPEALKVFADQAKMQLLYKPEVVSTGRSTTVVGDLDKRAALELLLKGTGFEVVFSKGNAATIRPVGAGRSGTNSANSPGESARGLAVDDSEAGIAGVETVTVFGSLEEKLSIGSKSGQSLRETPKSVTVLTRERVEAQNLTSLSEALTQTTGITVSSFNPTDPRYYSRGFRLQTIQIDGGAPAYTAGFGAYLAPDMAIYDHVEMLRGVDGMYSGAGEPGGVVNLVHKRAQAEPAIQLNVSAGSWNQYRGELDVTGALTSDGRLRGRLVGALEDKEYFQDRSESAKKIAFATAEYDLTPATLLVAGTSYERRKEDGLWSWGLPRYSDGTDLRLPRSTTFAQSWDHWYLTTKDVFARLEQNYGKTGVLKVNLVRLDQRSEILRNDVYGNLDPVTLTGLTTPVVAIDYQSVQNLADISANGTFELFGLEHRYTVGTDYSKIDGGGQREYDYLVEGYGYPGLPLDVFNFDPSSYPRPTVASLTRFYPVNEQSQRGYYATLGLQLAEPLRLTLGGRYGEYRYHRVIQPVQTDGTYGTANNLRYNDSKFIPSAALMWNFSSDWSAYASYAETFKVQANLLKAPLPGTSLDPVTGGGYEIGVKGEVLNNLNVAAAIYRIKRNGQGARDFRYPFTTDTEGASCCYVKQANVTSEGVDVELSGVVLPGWQMFAGYTYNTSEYDGPDNARFSSGASFLTRTPRHMFKVWTIWDLPGRLSRWTVNAGVVGQTDTHVIGEALATPDSTDYIPYRFSQGGYAVWNASVQYRFNDTWTIGLYGDNLLDKNYYAVISDVTYSANVYGVPRSYVLTLRGRW